MAKFAKPVDQTRHARSQLAGIVGAVRAARRGGPLVGMKWRASADALSAPFHEVFNIRAKRFRNASQNDHGGITHPPFNAAQIGLMHIGARCQLLLRQVFVASSIPLMSMWR